MVDITDCKKCGKNLVFGSGGGGKRILWLQIIVRLILVNTADSYFSISEAYNFTSYLHGCVNVSRSKVRT